VPDWLVPFVDPWTTPATLWVVIVAIAALLRLRGRPLAIIAAGSAVTIALWKAWSIGPPNGLLDLQIYTGSARAWLDGGSLFSYRSPVFNLSATYPPIGILPFALLSPLPVGLREVLFTCLSLLSIGVAARCAAVLAGVEPGRRLDWTLWAVALAIVTVPIWLTLRQGQLNAILWMLVLGDIVLVRRGSRLAGVSIGIATAIKLVPGLFILWLMISGLRRPALRAVATTVALTAVGWLLAPSDSRSYWTEQLWHSDRVGQVDDARNNSLLGGLSHMLPSGTARTLLWLALAGTLGVVGMWRARSATKRDDLLAAAILVGCTAALISPISWTHHLGYLVLALAAFVPYATTIGRRALFILLTVLIIDPGHLGDDLAMSILRMALMVLIVLALPIVDGRSAAGSPPEAGRPVQPATTEPTEEVQAASTPSSLSTNS
jgi:alpha-1,2-mannosyltransferase